MISYIRGYYVITLEGINTEKFLNTLIRNRVDIYDVKRISNSKLQFKIDRKDMKTFKNIYKNSKYEVIVKQKIGIPFLAKRVYKKTGMWICAIISLFLLMGTSLFVTDIYIQAPEGIDKVGLRKELKEAGIKPGVYKKNIDRKEVRDYIMSKFNDIAYISINVKGTNIFVTVTKKDESLKEKKETDYCNIIAKKNGIINKVIPRSGSQVVNAGDIVRSGDVLVSGANTKSMPEVWAITFYESKQSASYIEQTKVRTGNKKRVYSISFYDKKFVLRRNIDFKNYEIENKVYELKIGNYTFPIKIQSSTFCEVNIKEIKKDKEEVKKELKEKALKDLEYKIPVDARDINVKHQYKVNKSKKDQLEYIVIVDTLENISKIQSLSKSEVEELIRQENEKKEKNSEPIPSNPEKRPINDIRNEFKDTNKDENEKDKKDDNKQNN